MINLLPNKSRAADRADYFRRVISVGLILAALAFLLGNILLALLAWKLQNEIDGLANLRQAEESKTDRTALITARKLLAQTKNQLTVLDSLKSPERASVSFFERILATRPEGVKILSLSYSTSTDQAGIIILTGVASTRNALLKWIEALRSEPVFIDVESPVGNIIKERNNNFTITLTIN